MNEDEVYKAIIATATERRKELKMSQAELAALVGTSQTAISRIEGGYMPMARTVLRIINALGLKLTICG